MTTTTFNRIMTTETENNNNNTNMITNLFNEARLFFKRRKMLNELYDLDDRILDDIGVSRCDLHDFVRKHCK